MASRISSTRSFQSLRRSNSLPKNTLPQLSFESIFGGQVHRLTQNVLQVALQPDELEKSDGFGELYQNIHVALRPGLVAGDRAEDSQTFHPEPVQLFLVLRKYP